MRLAGRPGPTARAAAAGGRARRCWRGRAGAAPQRATLRSWSGPSNSPMPGPSTSQDGDDCAVVLLHEHAQLAGRERCAEPAQPADRGRRGRRSTGEPVAEVDARLPCGVAVAVAPEPRAAGRRSGRRAAASGTACGRGRAANTATTAPQQRTAAGTTKPNGARRWQQAGDDPDGTPADEQGGLAGSRRPSSERVSGAPSGYAGRRVSWSGSSAAVMPAPDRRRPGAAARLRPRPVDRATGADGGPPATAVTGPPASRTGVRAAVRTRWVCTHCRTTPPALGSGLLGVAAFSSRRAVSAPASWSPALGTSRNSSPTQKMATSSRAMPTNSEEKASPSPAAAGAGRGEQQDRDDDGLGEDDRDHEVAASVAAVPPQRRGRPGRRRSVRRTAARRRRWRDRSSSSTHRTTAQQIARTAATRTVRLRRCRASRA